MSDTTGTKKPNGSGMAPNDTHANISGRHARGRVSPGCSVCAHPWSAHDQIATRFCDATAEGRQSRACVCTVRHTAGPGNG